MPTQTPVSLIKPLNRLFGSIDITIAPNNASMSFSAQQLPSTYYMDDTNAFLRLRPLHRSGFGMFERATRVVGLYVGNWDGNASYQVNSQNAAEVIFRNLGSTANDIRTAIQNLVNGQTLTTAQLITQNTAVVAPPIVNQVVYINDGAMQGTIWGGNAAVTGSRYQPMCVVDATTINDRAHTGHAFATRPLVEQFYTVYYPGLLDQMMRLGYSAQSLAIAIGANGLPVTEQVTTDREYFPRSAFGDNRQRQLEFMCRFFGSFV
ncbi:hypothetical protein [Pannonibacter carbonis]|uniref:hypothetical protein n=1 Tax=Pannonibacter carbonis TaxID=2067569 RepID=UPI000D111E9E|nr:hypothetical protein [Pannonibacter carbonis]